MSKAMTCADGGRLGIQARIKKIGERAFRKQCRMAAIAREFYKRGGNRDKWAGMTNKEREKWYEKTFGADSPSGA